MKLFKKGLPIQFVDKNDNVLHLDYIIIIFKVLMDLYWRYVISGFYSCRIEFFNSSIFHALGSDVFLNKKYRNSDNCREFQRGLVFPLTFLGSGWVILGTLYYALYQGKDSTSFYIWLAVITIPAFIILAFNKFKK